MSGTRASRSAPQPASGARPLALTRRAVLSGVSQAALVAGLVGCGESPTPREFAAATASTGEPWDDGTFWEDGTGWVD